ncbi:unnamed protein product [Microthlaspi erraticum]|uniref:Knottin scorpion toxin-like domain-containing protein n=1 Tax=Microthlaspi erraticum TaxID=1685480 RepID=A0A6D2KJL8_9BRAS|nr:unnamed protein product [Microthlaspi erraticum]
MVSFLKIVMIMALLVMSVNAKTIPECKQTACKEICNDTQSMVCFRCVFDCAYPGSVGNFGSIKQDMKCYRKCEETCLFDEDCYEKCTRKCH